jgi:hydroxylamine reductase
MFCYQCEQTAKGTGCTTMGVCGKENDTAILQDLLIHAVEGISAYAHRARELGAKEIEIDRFVPEALFATVTNVNFDSDKLTVLIKRASEIKNKARELYLKACTEKGTTPEKINGAASWSPADSKDGLVTQGIAASITKRKEAYGDDLAGLMMLLTYGLKGAAAYAYHAQILGQEDDEIYAFFHEALAFLTNENPAVDDLLAMNLKCGEYNFKIMGLLDKANTDAYGHPVPTEVLVTPVKGKAILISGHDLKDLEELLKQTDGKGINVYTHGEMLPAHGYPGLKKYAHLAGNYGGAWQDQHKEFDEFPGSILMTTNCIQKPKDSYKHRIFTCGPVEWPGVIHISDGNFSPLIDAALAEDGFTEDAPEKKIMVGFGHNTVLGVAGDVLDAVSKGLIKHFFLIGGCDGAKPGRNYYTDFAEAVPDDSIILTLACGKYRFNKLDFGTIGGLPRLLDVGQCNDAYSAIQIAVALADALGVEVNELPLSLVLSWYEQKAIAILLTLLYLGIKDIRLGPSLPAFVTPAVLNVLVEKFNIAPITTPEEDLKAMLA